MYNYRHSRARRVIENTFGILVAHWRIYNTPIHAKPENVEKIVSATIALHNYFRQTDNASYCPQGFINSEKTTGEITPGYRRKEVAMVSLAKDNTQAVANVTTLRKQRHTDNALLTRASLTKYVNSDTDLLSWQLDYVRRT